MSLRITKEEMLKLTETYSIHFPDEYVLYLTSSEETPKGKQVHIQEGQWSTDAVIHGFYSTAKELTEAIDLLEEDWWPNGYIAFAYDEGGNYFCISTKRENFGNIFYFLTDSIESDPEDALIRVCDSFSAFLKMGERE